MRYLKFAFRKLFRKGEHSTARIVSLATGLAFGLILLAEVFYYYSFDSFYPDSNRLYVVNSVAKLEQSSEELTVYPRVSGAIGPGLKAEVPGIEAATRITPMGGKLDFFSEENRVYSAKFVLADECLHELMPRPMLAGSSAAEILKSPMTCMMSSEIANNMGGDVTGQIIELKNYPGKKLTIGGIFEKFPENSNYPFDIAVSMISIGNFTWDGSNNWLGNDRYMTVVKLEKGVTPESIAPAVRAMQEKHQNIEVLERENGLKLNYSFESLQKFFSNQAKDMIVIMSAIAFIVLFVSIMNYLLLTVSTLVNRPKTSAIYKCYGAEKRDLQAMIFIENALLFVLSLLFAFAIILIVKPFVESQVAHSLTSMLNAHVIIPVLLILCVIVFLVGYLPGRVFAQIPVAEVFRSYRAKSTRWKKGLLAVQFVGVAIITAMLLVVSLQYDKMKSSNHGYDVEGVYYSPVSGIDPGKLQSVLNDLEALPEVERVGLGYNVPINSPSGNNVLSPDGQQSLFNVADYYEVDDNYFAVLNIPVLSGQAFRSDVSAPNDVMISQRGADLLVMNNGWSDGVVGKSIEVSEHNPLGASNITGVFGDLVNGTLNDNDTRPSVFFFQPRERFIEKYQKYPSYTFYILIKTGQGRHANVMQKFTNIFSNAIPRGEPKVYSLAAVQEGKYQAQKGFRNALYAGGFVIVLITIIGLIGYLNDEIARSRKSLAIRKINGATVNNIVRIFVTDIWKIAIPSVILGLAGAWYLASGWLSNFAKQISLHGYVFLITGIIILLLVSAMAVLNSLKAALRNPVESLKYE
ncbi:MAG: ABC transporter permease [Bacteroidota bacterium]|nr:ABC transporter permease [Bacteroidota bacterium]